jgi:hypothetical protein
MISQAIEMSRLEEEERLRKLKIDNGVVEKIKSSSMIEANVKVAAKEDDDKQS